MGLLQAAILGVIALIITPGFLFYFDVTPKVVVLLTGAGVVLLFGIFQARVRSWFSLLLAGSAAALVFSALLSSNPALSWFGGNWRRFGVVEQCAVLLLAWMVAAQCGGRPEKLRTLLRGVAVAAVIAGAYGILQYFGIDPLLPAAGYHIGEGTWTIVRPPGTMGYVSYFANWLAMAVFLCLALARLEEQPVLRYAALAAAGTAACAMALTGTRGALLAAAAGAVVLIGTRAWRITRRSLMVAAALAVAVFAFYSSPAGWNLHSRARWFREDPRGGARIDLWRDSLAMSLHRLPTGFGPEVFTAQFPHYESKELAEAYPDYAHESPHNMFLDALVGQGILGFAMLAALCVLALARAPSPWVMAAIVAGIVAQQFTVFTIPTAVLFYATLAFSAGAPEPRAPRRIGWPLRLAFAAPLALAMFYLAFRFAAADRSLELASRAIARGGAMDAATNFSAYERRRLPGVGSDLWYSQTMSVLAQRTPDKLMRIQTSAQAGYAALRATRTAEDPFNAWYNAASLYAGANDSAFAESSLRSAIAAHPNWFKPHWMLARVLLLEGRAEEARRQAMVAVELDGGKHGEVAETLRNCTQVSLQR
jgi:O-antigen ligase